MAVPRKLRIPKNLFFVGTVNVDETTYIFSLKVLDRAFTIELDEVDLKGYGAGAAPAQQGNLSLAGFTGLGTSWRRPSQEDWVAFGELDGGSLRAALIDLNSLLSGWHRHFGYWVAYEIACFVRLAHDQSGGGVSEVSAAFDLAVLRKVLPKFHGTQQELEKALETLFGFAIAGTGDGPTAPLDLADWAPDAGRLKPQGENSWASKVRLPRTACKLWQMRRRLREQGFTSYIE